jgi:NAD(P)-dependent dehydrogenase (short-subunit alcohol dehydrogenase family)
MGFQLPDQLMFIKNGKATQKHCEEPMVGKTCVITGATSGVGYAAAKALAAGGANIVLVARNEDKARQVQKELEETYSVTVGVILADFSDLNQVRRAAQQILLQYPTIDVLINSAGMHSTKRILNQEGLEMVFCVNHLASFLLTKLLLQRMIESSPSRIIQVNSEGHRFNGLNLKDLNWDKRFYTGLRSYGASKTAQLLTVWQWARELQGTGVTINALHPGGVRTNIGQNNGVLYRWFFKHVTWHFLKDPSISGDALYYLASAKELSKVSGKFFNLTLEEKPAKHALNNDNQQAVWSQSLRMTGFPSEDEVSV